MLLRIIGECGPYPKPLGATSCYLLETENNKIVLDMGSGAFSKLSDIVKPEEISAIVISHFHADHSADLAIFAYYLQQLEKRGRFSGSIPLYCPRSESPLAELAKSFKYFSITEVDNGKSYEVSGDILTFYKGVHPEPSYGVKVESGSKTFAYSGDTNVCDNVDKLFYSSDLVMLDGGLLSGDYSEKSPHLSVKKCVEYANKWGNKLIITHICPLYTEDEIKEEAKEGLNCRIAKEGTVYLI